VYVGRSCHRSFYLLVVVRVCRLLPTGGRPGFYYLIGLDDPPHDLFTGHHGGTSARPPPREKWVCGTPRVVPHPASLASDIPRETGMWNTPTYFHIRLACYRYSSSERGSHPTLRGERTCLHVNQDEDVRAQSRHAHHHNVHRNQDAELRRRRRRRHEACPVAPRRGGVH
jgi:hypothetical protein